VKRLVCLVLIACGPVDVVVADLPDIPDGGMPQYCTPGTDDCGEGNFCELARCGDPQGFCRQKPVSCEGAPMHPSCDCNSIEYENDCVREQAGVSRGPPC
jgi:hypothetical protein